LSISWQPDVTPAPRILVLPPAVDSLEEAHAAIEMWEHYSRKVLDGSQRLAVEVMMAESKGRWAARTTGREMPRQNGKDEEFEVVELWGLVQRAEAVLHTAHELTTVSNAHQRMVSLVEGSGDLRRRVRKILNGIGQQLIEFKNDGVVAYRTRTNGGGRGLDDISRLFVNEAQHAKPEQLASSTPILLANPNPQMNFAGTGAISGVSDWWWELRKRALSENPGQFGYVGHTAETVRLEGDKVIQEPVDPWDRDLWFAANPALHAGRGEVEFFEEQLRTLGPALFAREHLGVWDAPPDASGSVIPNWSELKDLGSRIVTHRHLALDVSPDRRWASIGAAGRDDNGRLFVEAYTEPGTSWVLSRAEGAWRETKCPVRVERTGPGGSFIEPLRERGVEVVEVSHADVGHAVGQVLDACANDGLRHWDGLNLSSAVAGAVLRDSGDTWVWSRKHSKVDISPLVAVTIAAGGVPAPSVPSMGLFVAVS
jgi:hypothetical protein